ncbi:MAG: tyrosine-type recombinase/integrase [Alphaproteobacteria bacterium]
MRVHLKPDLGEVRLADLKARRIERYLAGKLESGLSAGSVRHLRVILVMALDYAQRHQLVGRNEASLARGPRRSDFEASPLSPGETRQLIDALRGDREEALFVTLATLGLRLGEALGLRWRDVNLDADPFIMVRHSLVRRKGAAPALAETKTRTSRRRMALPARLVDLLRRHRTTQLEERLIAGPDWQAQDFVFGNTKGGPGDHAAIYKRFQRALRKAGLRRIRVHDLRHGAATALLLDGVDLKRVSSALGHSRISTTADTYTHVLEALDAGSAARLDSLFLAPQDGSGGAVSNPSAVKSAVKDSPADTSAVA